MRERRLTEPEAALQEVFICGLDGMESDRANRAADTMPLPP